MNIIVDGRTLDKVRADMVDPATAGRRHLTRLAYYSWPAYLAEMKSPDKYAAILFVNDFSARYNVSVRFISDIYDKPQIYYLGLTAPTDCIILRFLPSGEHYYVSRPTAVAIPEELHQQDTPILDAVDFGENGIIGPMDNNTIEMQSLNTDLLMPQAIVEPEH